MGHGYSGSVLEGEGPIFLQAMGQRAEDAQRAGRTACPDWRSRVEVTQSKQRFDK